MTAKKDHDQAEETEPTHNIDFSKLEKLTFDQVRGKLTPVEISEYNNLLAQINGEIKSSTSKEELEKFKKRVESMYKKTL